MLTFKLYLRLLLLIASNIIILGHMVSKIEKQSIGQILVLGGLLYLSSPLMWSKMDCILLLPNPSFYCIVRRQSFHSSSTGASTPFQRRTLRPALPSYPIDLLSTKPLTSRSARQCRPSSEPTRL